MVSGFRDIIAYRKAYEVSLDIHKLTLSFPSYEQHELAGQLRRASKSVAMNIAEGFGRKTHSLAEFKRFLVISRSSCDEVRVQLDYCKDLGYIDETTYNNLEASYIEIGKILTAMIKTWK